MDGIAKSFELIADALNRLRRRQDAQVSYDLLSDALVWSDEFPTVSALEFNERFSNIRFLFRYRTTLILQSPDEQYESLWNLAGSLFPNWPGFADDRCQSSQQLIDLFHQQRRLAMKSLPDD